MEKKSLLYAKVGRLGKFGTFPKSSYNLNYFRVTMNTSPMVRCNLNIVLSLLFDNKNASPATSEHPHQLHFCSIKQQLAEIEVQMKAI